MSRTTLYEHLFDERDDSLSSLLINAIHYHWNEGEIWINCHAAQGTAALRVFDSGSGILPVNLPEVFKHFYRADPARTQAEGHYGLVLANCKAIIDAARRHD